MVEVYHEPVEEAAQERAHVGQQPRHPEPVVAGLQHSQHLASAKWSQFFIECMKSTVAAPDPDQS